MVSVPMFVYFPLEMEKLHKEQLTSMHKAHQQEIEELKKEHEEEIAKLTVSVLLFLAQFSIFRTVFYL